MKPPIKLYYWSPLRSPNDLQWLVRSEWRAWRQMSRHGSHAIRNFGDELSTRVVEVATGRGTRWAAPKRAEVFAIGSILEHHHAGHSPSVIWGSGLRYNSRPVGHAPTLLAVRGALTREVYGESADLPLGDPGLLARALYKSRSPRSKVILLPHFSAFGTVSGRQSIQAGAAKGMHVLPPTLAVDDVCQAIADARLVITSSLHGLIVGHATRTPTILCTFGHTQEPDFKYFDYMSPYRRSPTLVPFSHLLEHGVRNWEEAAAEEVEAVSDEIDDLIEGLLAAAGPLR